MQSKYYEIRISKQTKPVGRVNPDKYYADWTTYDKTTERMETIEEVKAYLQEHYKGHKRNKVYRDAPEGEAVHVGYTYSWKDYDWSSGYKYHYYEMHWVEVCEITSNTIIIK